MAISPTTPIILACSELPSDYHGVPRDTYGREVYYDLPDPNLKQATQWLIGNPNRINLGRIGLTYKGNMISASQIAQPNQVLDLWNGVLTSTFQIDGKDVKVVTQGDFDEDAVAFTIESDLLTSRELEVFVGVYDFPMNHTTSIISDNRKDTAASIKHQLQETMYFANLRWPAQTPLSLVRNEPENANTTIAHRYTLKPSSTSGIPSTISFTSQFSPDQRIPPLPSAIQKRNKLEWNQYWKEGGFVDLTASSNSNATELQRRIITSQYHVRVNSAAKGQSPQESGLMNNGWYGKFHMEMVIWHNAHWATWGRKKYFDNIFPELYESFLPSSLARAKSMGWEGAKWPKMTDPIVGINSPGDINALLLWQQPHPMYLAQLAYQASPTRKTLERWDHVLTETANFMASYAGLNTSTGQYDLGPPTYGVTENTPPNSTRNLAYEIAYWRYGLDIAQEWKRKLGQRSPAKWTQVASNLAPPPQIDGLYAVYDGLNSSWWNDTKLTGDPRSLIMLQGILPDTPAVDPAIALATANKVWEVWTDDKIRGWGRPVLAINSARTGNASRAMYHLTAYDYWKFDDAGFAIRGGDGGTPPPFMPGNAGFLYAIAYLVKGWEGSRRMRPGTEGRLGC
ncbi:hypothetical protein N0V90_008784 [Kalmusia sp. IMI 367209]|nr:hypothetical protein N0V90_008784 [Kalmusia sp. IMI 367209]